MLPRAINIMYYYKYGNENSMTAFYLNKQISIDYLLFFKTNKEITCDLKAKPAASHAWCDF
jgi:hypothetical protein